MTNDLEIILSKNQAEELKKHSRENSPNESCAILFGKTDNGKTITREIFLTSNIENSPTVFTISNEELIMAYGKAEKKLLDVVGIFHSHPDSAAYPSETDRKYMQINPVPWIIFSNRYNEFKAYIFDSELVSIPVKIS